MQDKKNINISKVKITSLSVNPNIFNPNVIDIGVKSPKKIMRIVIVRNIFPNFLKFPFKKPMLIRSKDIIVNNTVIPVI